MTAPSTAGIVVASGVRLGVPIATAEVDGERLVDRAVRLLRAAGCEPVYTILGAWEGSVDNCLVIVDHGWERGESSAVRIGLKWARAASGAEGVLVVRADRDVTEAGIRRLMGAPGALVQATYGGRAGYPLRVSAEQWQPVLDTLADAGDSLAGLLDTDVIEIGDVSMDTDLCAARGPDLSVR